MKLTKAQRKILEYLRKNKDDPYKGSIVYSGLDCYYGNYRTSHRMLTSLLRLCLVSKEDLGENTYVINECGKRALKGLPPYCDGQGSYHETLEELGLPSPYLL